MLAYIARRLLAMIPLMILVSIITFIIIQLPPGDFFDSLRAEMAETGGGQAHWAIIVFLILQGR